MDEAKRKALTEGLSAISGRIAAEMRERMLSEREVRARAEQLHADERVGEDFEVWTDLLSRRAAVMWVLKSVYVRVLEDRKLITPRRIVDATSPQLFGKLAPDLGDTAYLRWVYRDLAQPDGGLPELFALSAAELVWPSDALSRELLDFWRQRDPDTGELVYRFDHERFDGRLMGDLYQDLDPVVKDRFALLQTPDFILAFILDETLTPAIEQFGVDEVRLLDPACGSGHFLLEAFRRLVAAMREAHPERPVGEIVADVLSRVVGIDLNDYACGLARARLVMTALETLGSSRLADASHLHPQVFWADGLEQIERDEMEQTSLDLGDEVIEKPRAMLTQPEVRAHLRPVLKARFHAVVGNPPYITEKDDARKSYAREKIGKRQRYESAYDEYSLVAPFVERFFQLALPAGLAGAIVADSFSKRRFGKALVTKVLARVTLSKVVDSSVVTIPGHGTPTLILVGSRSRPSGEASVRVVVGKRGDLSSAGDRERRDTWESAVRAARATDPEEDEFTRALDLDATVLDAHPWRLSASASELDDLLSGADSAMGAYLSDFGFGCVSKTDDAFELPASPHRRAAFPQAHSVPAIAGQDVRNWQVSAGTPFAFPYDSTGAPIPETELGLLHDYLWPRRTTLFAGAGPGFKSKRSAGRQYYEYGMWYPHRFSGEGRLTCAYKATHNHFSACGEQQVYKQTAPLSVLREGLGSHVCAALLAQLNSSISCYWLRTSSQKYGGASEAWAHRFEVDGRTLKTIPLATDGDVALATLSKAALLLARERSSSTAAQVIAEHSQRGASEVRTALRERRDGDTLALMRLVAIQEEVDWRVYALWGLADEALSMGNASPPPLVPGARAFELELSESGVGTEWFEKHGWSPLRESDVDGLWRLLVKARRAAIRDSEALQTLEVCEFKRRWPRPDYDKEEHEAMALWLADRVEREVQTRTEPFAVRSIAAALQHDASVEAVATLYAGAGFDLDQVVAQILDEESVPNLKSHVFKKKGLVKRAAWERTWDLQHAEDAWDAKKKAHDDAIAAGVDPHEAPPLPEGQRPEPEVPPKYGSGDYLKPTYWKQRGKLDVPKERFIAYSEAPGELTENGEQPLYGWAGWDHLRRAQVLLALDEQAEDAGVDLKDRYGLLWGVQFLLPYVRWGDDKAQSAASEFAAILRDLVGDTGITDTMLAEWAKVHPPPKGRPKAKKPKAKKTARKKKS